MFIQVNHAQSSKALSYGWTDLSAKGGLRKGSDLLKELGYDVNYICAEGYDHDFVMWDEYIRVALDELLPLKRAAVLPED